MVSAVQGLRLTAIKAGAQPIPHIPRAVTKLRSGDFGRRWPGSSTFAMTLEAVIARRQARRAIREQNGLDPQTLVLLDGCCKDDVLDNLWERRHDLSLYDLLKREEPCIVIAPEHFTVCRDAALPQVV